MSLFRAIVKASVKNLGNLAGSFVFVPVAGDIAVDAWDNWSQEADEKQRKAEIEAHAQQAIRDAVEEARDAVRREAAHLPSAAQQQLVDYLSLVPGAIRRSLKRPADVSGRTVPFGLAFNKANDLLPLLPLKLPRFKPGDQPLPNTDLQLVELLGEGGFGEVWKACHLDRPKLPPVVLKFPTEASAIKALERERDLLDHVAAAGRHDGIVQLLYAHLRAQTPCLEYEFVEGGDLAGVMAELQGPGRPTAQQVAQMILTLARIMAYAHGQSPAIVHRDLKPANILTSRRDGQWHFKIADFGIGALQARQALHDVQTGKTKASQCQRDTILGAYTPLYASPEQVGGAQPDPRDDVHALGIIWYQLQTGKAGLLLMPSDWRDDMVASKMPPAFLELLAACIGRAERRPKDAAELVKRMTAAMGVTGAEQRGPVSAPTPANRGFVPQPRPHAAAPAKKPTPNAAVKWVGAVVGAALTLTAVVSCVAGLVYYLSGSEDGSQGNNTHAGGPTATTNRGPAGASDKGDLPKSYVVKDVGITTCLISAGRFTMGSPPGEKFRDPTGETPHKVRLTRPFYLSGHPITRGQFRQFVKEESYKTEAERASEKPTWLEAGFPQDDDHTVVCVSWNDAVKFCEWLSKKTGQKYGLPTEAQWEYACRGKALDGGGVEITTDPYYCGKTLTPKQANYGDSQLKGTTKVGQYPPNGFGLFDMHGNCYQWCQDWHGDYETKGEQVDPTGPADGLGRILRGGSWTSAASICRAANRKHYGPWVRHNTIGFRVCRVVAEGKQ
jgi:formylglycine-generating enzyme required for sulfatase activity/serine/threonine protein kinase